MNSMTGYGRGEASNGDVSVVVELKSVNSRFCEISIRGPRNLSEKEVDVRCRSHASQTTRTPYRRRSSPRGSSRCAAQSSHGHGELSLRLRAITRSTSGRTPSEPTAIFT